MTRAEFIAFGQARHGQWLIQPLADETGYSYAQIYGIVHRGRRVTERLETTISLLPKKPKKRKSAG